MNGYVYRFLGFSVYISNTTEKGHQVIYHQSTPAMLTMNFVNLKYMVSVVKQLYNFKLPLINIKR